MNLQDPSAFNKKEYEFCVPEDLKPNVVFLISIIVGALDG